MIIEALVPINEMQWLDLRTKDLTSTEVAALFGASPYFTAFELWHRKKGSISVGFQENDRVVWGKRLEEAIAEGVAEDQGWSVRRKVEYMRIPSLRLGASFDFDIEGGGLLEIKNVDSLAFRDGWIVDEAKNVEAPPHIEIQVQHQLMVSAAPFAYIAALVGGNRVVLIRREPDPSIFEAIKLKAATFWNSIDMNEAPKPDFSTDLDTISRLYGYSTPDKVMDASESQELFDLASIYRVSGEQEKLAKSRKDAAKAEILTLIKDAEKVLGNGFSISAGTVGSAPIAYTREGYRTFRVNWKKVSV